jgi:hypothetical protein
MTEWKLCKHFFHPARYSYQRFTYAFTSRTATYKPTPTAAGTSNTFTNFVTKGTMIVKPMTTTTTVPANRTMT